MSIFISKNIKFFIINYNSFDKYIFIYTYGRYISFYNRSINFYKLSNTVLINYNNCLSGCVVNNYLTNYLYDWESVFIKKIKFKGKGYKIIKTKNTLYLVFNRSHIT